MIEDTDAHERAKAAGAEILEEPHDKDYGSRDYTAHDLEDNVWVFGTYDPFCHNVRGPGVGPGAPAALGGEAAQC